MKSTIIVAGLLLITITVINAYPRRRPVYDVTGQDRTPYNKYGGHVDNQQEEEEEEVYYQQEEEEEAPGKMSVISHSSHMLFVLVIVKLINCNVLFP